VTAVLALGVLTSSLRDTAVAVLQIGRADFSVSQKGASDVLYSTMSKQEIDSIRDTRGVVSAIGAFVRTANLGKSRPFFLEIGLAPATRRATGFKSSPGARSPPIGIGIAGVVGLTHVSERGSPSPARWRTIRRSSSRTNRPAASTTTPPHSLSGCCAITALAVSHDRRLTEAADRVLRLECGRIVAMEPESYNTAGNKDARVTEVASGR
jgi:hypothetical protein